MKTNDEKFKNIIKQAATDATPAGFTDAIMKAIEADAALELALKNVLQQHPAEGPAMNFTANIMSQINAKPEGSVYKPIISKRVGYSIAGVIAAFIAFIVLSNPSASATNTPFGLNIVLQYVHAIPSVYVMAMALVGILLLADYLVTQHFRKAEMA